uniref:RING-type domain-containing protein n=1 Tax=viral metagenome TaxID=1070528 RepID=A0A6C0H3Y7_9ZZZZ
MSAPITEPEECSEECSICFRELTGTNDVKLKNCCHVFHKDCLAPWVNAQNNTIVGITICPLCKTVDTIDFTLLNTTDAIVTIKTSHYCSFPRPPKNPKDILIWRNSTQAPSITHKRQDYVDDLTGLCPMPHFLTHEPPPPENASFKKLKEAYSRALTKYEIATYDLANAIEYNTLFLRNFLAIKSQIMTIQEEEQNEHIAILTRQWYNDAHDALNIIGIAKWIAYVREEQRIKKEEEQGNTVRGRIISTLRGISKKERAKTKTRMLEVMPLLVEKKLEKLPPKPVHGTLDHEYYKLALEEIKNQERDEKCKRRQDGPCSIMGGKHNKSKKIRHRKHRKAKKSRKIRK